MSEKCSECRTRQAAHRISSDEGTVLLCCECYVRGGNPPSDWHIACMAEWARSQGRVLTDEESKQTRALAKLIASREA